MAPRRPCGAVGALPGCAPLAVEAKLSAFRGGDPLLDSLAPAAPAPPPAAAAAAAPPAAPADPPAAARMCCEALVDGLREALDGVEPGSARVLFTAHSIPTSMANESMYVGQLENAVELIRERIDSLPRADLVWQSRSGPPTVPWLEPDIVDVIDDLPDDVSTVIVVPVGFISDHMEVIQDLDTDAAEPRLVAVSIFAGSQHREPTRGSSR